MYKATTVTLSEEQITLLERALPELLQKNCEAQTLRESSRLQQEEAALTALAELLTHAHRDLERFTAESRDHIAAEKREHAFPAYLVKRTPLTPLR